MTKEENGIRTYEEIKQLIKLSVQEIHKMKHCIGLDREYNKKTYFAYRNRYVTYETDRDFERLMMWGLAERYDNTYMLTKNGIEVLSDILGIEVQYD